MNSHRVFVVHGASGCGKSTLLRYLELTYPNISIHVKASDREPRKIDVDTKHVPREYFYNHKEEFVAIYERYDNFYGLYKDQWDTAYAECKVHLAVVSDIATIRRLKQQYRAIAIHVHTDPKNVEDALKKRIIDADEIEEQEQVKIEERIRRIVTHNVEYIENLLLFDHTVVNFFYPIEMQPAASRQFQQIFDHYLHQ